MNMTDEQRDTVRARGKVMVSASAGAGKTTVMIKRLADILVQDENADLDNVLCVTFTKKASGQMKEKLRKELIKRLDGAVGQTKEKLKLQLNKINSADISTIDSFCTRLVKTYFYELGTDASFEVMGDKAEVTKLKAKAMENVFDGLYAEGNAQFLMLLERTKRKRSDNSLRELISSAYDVVRIRPDYKEVLKNSCVNTFTQEGFEKICSNLKHYIDEKFKALVMSIDNFKAYFRTIKNDERYIKVLEDMQITLQTYIDCPDLFAFPQSVTVLKKPNGKSNEDDIFKAFKDKISKKFRELTKLGDREEHYARFISSGQTATAFVALLTAFDEAYSAVKMAEGKLDYSDLEQFSLHLLKDCADVKEAVNQKYKYVFVDEYQDVNPIQDAIIDLVADGDLFCVGDVKQAIYNFRGSRSKFFTEKSNKVKEVGSYFILPDNFRSSDSVIDFVNSLFNQVLKPPVSDVDYSDGHAMRKGGKYPPEHKGVAKFCFFDSEKEKEEADKVYSVKGDKASCKRFSPEGEAVLKVVKEALQTTYYDADEEKEELRVKKVQTGDICVLTRKRDNKKVEEIIKALSSEYPVEASAEVNLCERAEIVKLLDVLSYLDNAEQDVPLASALLSPIGKLNEKELADIRLYGGDLPFRQCVKKYANEKTDQTAQKLKDFFKETERLRLLSGSIGSAKLIDEIMGGGGFSAEFATDTRQSYLKALKREAFSPTGELSLNAFLTKIKAGAGDIKAPSQGSSGSITVMTMHASKGLEFPVVIVADIANTFKGKGGSYKIPYDDELGFAPRYYGDDRTYKDTLFGMLCNERLKREELANEANLFYVACTRAKYALYVLSSRKPAYDPQTAVTATDYVSLVDFDNLQLPCEYIELNDNSSNKRGGNIPSFNNPDEETYQAIKDISEYQYGYELGIKLPVKSSASRLIYERDNEENALPLFDASAEKDGETNPQKGIAYHRFLELCDFKIKDLKGVLDELNMFLEQGLITQEQRDLLDVNTLYSILSMPVFERTNGKSLFREREFLCKLPSSDYLRLREGVLGEIEVGEDDGNGVIVQGAIDLLCVKRNNGKAISADIIDYKFSIHSDEYLRQKYAPQLGLYKSVVCKIYGLEKSSVTTTIVNIKSCRQIEIEV
ncbi:MAG: UvrD-helicase domain-containing protein [Candidatus Coproplasma sp.]